jgi:hypothetical protein
MPKVTGPLFSLGASGTLAKTLVYVCGHLTRVAENRDKASQKPPTEQSNKFSDGAATWGGFDVQLKDAWASWGKVIRDSRACIGLEYYLTGYQLWLSYYLTYGVDGWENYPFPPFS